VKQIAVVVERVNSPEFWARPIRQVAIVKGNPEEKRCEGRAKAHDLKRLDRILHTEDEAPSPCGIRATVSHQNVDSGITVSVFSTTSACARRALYEQCGVLAAQPSSASFRIALAVRILLFPRRGKLPFSQRLVGPVWVSTTGEPTLTSRIPLHFGLIFWL